MSKADEIITKYNSIFFETDQFKLYRSMETEAEDWFSLGSHRNSEYEEESEKKLNAGRKLETLGNRLIITTSAPNDMYVLHEEEKIRPDKINIQIESNDNKKDETYVQIHFSSPDKETDVGPWQKQLGFELDFTIYIPSDSFTKLADDLFSHTNSSLLIYLIVKVKATYGDVYNQPGGFPYPYEVYFDEEKVVAAAWLGSLIVKTSNTATASPVDEGDLDEDVDMWGDKIEHEDPVVSEFKLVGNQLTQMMKHINWIAVVITVAAILTIFK